ncbi:hypothetical protein AVEN_242175-1 [Araneus ventricosus]|uniref:BTB domain-containing protein n=1 Tax=Araneus ventricosus TaxID=182803 RepID=A0A4Y2DHS9_ARAVE|nr:hypothetical protein AVEN_242175-1 [Araneus ventricosus]
MTQKCEDIASGNTMTGWIDTKAITRITTKMHRIRWTIENLSKVAFDTKLTGPDFYLTPTRITGLAFKRNERNIFVYVCNKSDTEIQIERNICLFACNDKKLHEDKDAKIFTLEKGKDIDIVGRVQDRSRFDALPNNTLIIDLSISMRGDITTEICRFKYVMDPQKKLIEDLKTMQENAVNSDVSLQIGNERIPAHWSILCSRSPYFKKMFDSNMKERVENSIIITDLSFSTLKKLVEFLFTAHFLENDKGGDMEELFELYYAADKYEIMDLRTLCAGRILNNASVNNVW